MKIELVKLYNGDFIMGEVDDIGDSLQQQLSIDNPRQVLMMPSMSGSMSIALKPVCFPFNCKRLKDKLNLEKSQVMFTLHEDEIDDELVNGYKSEVSGIKIASAAETVSIASTSKTTSPKEFII